MDKQIARRSYRGETPTQRADKRREQLIAAAIQVYGELGYRQATVRAVCSAAGLSDRYFYAAFDNSEALLAAAFGAVTAEVLTEVQQAGDAQPPSDIGRARAMLEAYFTALRRESARARVFLVEMVGISDRIDREFDEMLDRIVARIIEAVDPDRKGPLANAPLLGRGVASGLIGIATAWVRSDYAEPVETVTAAALTLCLVAAPGTFGEDADRLEPTRCATP